MVTRQDTFASQLTLKWCAKPQSGIQITSIKIYSIYASTKNIRTYEYVIYLLNAESIEILRKKSRIFLSGRGSQSQTHKTEVGNSY